MKKLDRIIRKILQEGDTYEKMAAKGKKAGNLKQGTVRKRLGIPKDEKIPLSKINKELSRLKKMDKDKDKKGVQLGDKNQKYYKALQLSKTLKTTTNVNEDEIDEGTCGYGEDGKIGKIPAGPHLNEVKSGDIVTYKGKDHTVQRIEDDDLGVRVYIRPNEKSYYGGRKDTFWVKPEDLNEDMNDPVLVKARAAKMAAEKEKAKQAELDKKYGSSFMDKLDAEINLKQELQNLKDEREDVLMRIEDIGVETEQTAEPEGGPIADELGERLMAAERELRAIDNKIIDVKDELGYFRMYESVNENEIPSYLAKNVIFGKAVEDSVNFNDFQKRVYGILGPKYYKLTDQDALKNFYDSIRVTKPNMEEELFTPNEMGDEAVEREASSAAYESLQESLRKKLQDRLK